MRLLIKLYSHLVYSPKLIWRDDPNLISNPPGGSLYFVCWTCSYPILYNQEDLPYD